MKHFLKLLTIGISLTSSLSFARSITSGKGGICDRSEDIQTQIMKELGMHNCADVTKEDLARVTSLWLGYSSGNLKHDKTRMKELKVNDLAGLYNLLSFDIEFSEISVFDKEMFKDLKSLEVLDISHNQMKEIPEDLFKYNLNLKHIELDSNYGFDPKVGFGNGTLPEKLFYGLTKLESVDMDELKLKSLPKNIFATNPNLTGIDLKNNKLTDISGIFDNLKYLTNLELEGNPVFKK